MENTLEDLWDQENGVGSFADLDFELQMKILRFGSNCRQAGIEMVSNELNKDRK